MLIVLRARAWSGLAWRRLDIEWLGNLVGGSHHCLTTYNFLAMLRLSAFACGLCVHLYKKRICLVMFTMFDSR